jgi:hypothetical protein
MDFWSFLRREALILSRRRGTFAARVTSVALVLLALAVLMFIWDWYQLDRASREGMARFTLTAFVAVVAIQAIVTWGVVPGEVAPTVAGERERKTLDALLASGLTSAEVVLGMASAGMVKHLSGLAAVLPVLLIMVPLGGVDPRLVGLAYAALLSTSFALGSLAAAVSVGARDRQRAVGWSVMLGMAWMFGPFMAVLFLPRLWPWLASWVGPLARWALNSTPVGVLLSFTGVIGGRRTLVEAVAWMVALQAAAGVVLLAFAVLRLRPACRAIYDQGPNWSWFRPIVRKKRWPPCGDDPVFWRERYTRPIATPFEAVIGWLVIVGVLGSLAAFTGLYAVPAFRDLLTFGYGAATERVDVPEMHPVVTGILRVFSPSLVPPPRPGVARAEFNWLLRQFTAMWSFLFILSVGTNAATGVAREKVKDTWLGLIATPLEGRDVLRAKTLAALWKARGLVYTMGAIWLVGLAAGAVHPVGLLLTVVVVAAAGWSAAALGTYWSLRADTPPVANNKAMTLPLLLSLSVFLPRLLPEAARATVLGAGSAPMASYLTLVSYEDVRVASLTGVFPPLQTLSFVTGVPPGEGLGAVALTIIIGLVGHALGAAAMTAAAYRGFDAAVGRPQRPREADAPG